MHQAILVDGKHIEQAKKDRYTVMLVMHSSKKFDQESKH